MPKAQVEGLVLLDHCQFSGLGHGDTSVADARLRPEAARSAPGGHAGTAVVRRRAGPRIEYVSDNVPRLEFLRFLRRVQEQQIQQTDRWIAAEERRAAGAARAERVRPPADPAYALAHGIGESRRPFEVHTGECRMGKRTKPVTEEEARRALAEGVEACQFCRPDTALGLL
jgi:hypothetical protein